MTNQKIIIMQTFSWGKNFFRLSMEKNILGANQFSEIPDQINPTISMIFSENLDS